MSENLAFTDRAIRKAQTLQCLDPFCAVITDYLLRFGRLKYDMERNLFWVFPATAKPQVAVWMIETAETERAVA